jgi:autotransporter-associated beta strand protein
VTNTGLTTLSGNIGQSGSGRGLTKAGADTLTLAGTNTYPGTTTVTAGTLLVKGSQAGSAVTVKAGATLAGTGMVGTVTAVSGAQVAPGAGTGLPGILTAAALTLPSGSTFNVALNGTTAGSGYSQLTASGTINLTGSTLSVSLGFTPAIGNSFTIIDNTGASAVVGTFNGLAQNGTFTLGGMMFQISYTGGDGNDVVLTRIS